MLCLCWSDWVSELGMHPSLVLGRGWGGVAFPVPLPFPSSGCGPRTLLPSHERVSFSPVLAAVSFHRCPKEAALVALSPHFLYTHTPPPHTHTQIKAFVLLEKLRGKGSRLVLASPTRAVIKDIIGSMEDMVMCSRD